LATVRRRTELLEVDETLDISTFIRLRREILRADDHELLDYLTRRPLEAAATSTSRKSRAGSRDAGAGSGG
jgi:hypothetical protein